MRASQAQVTGYVSGLATYLVRVGAELGAQPTLDVYDGGVLGFDIEAVLPGAGAPNTAEIRLSETWRPRSAAFERDEYEYELVDRERHRRRAFHRHHPEVFLRRAETAIHEHCEEVLGQPDCDHHVGLPLRDGYEAIERILLAWTEPEDLGCVGLDCLDSLLGAGSLGETGRRRTSSSRGLTRLADSSTRASTHRRPPPGSARTARRRPNPQP